MNNLWPDRKCLLHQLFDSLEQQWPRAWALWYAAWVQSLAALLTRMGKLLTSLDLIFFMYKIRIIQVPPTPGFYKD